MTARDEMNRARHEGWEDFTVPAMTPDATRTAREPVCLTADEADGLRALLAFLATFEERAYDPNLRLYQCTTLLWNDLTAEPKAKLSRFVGHRLVRP